MIRTYKFDYSTAEAEVVLMVDTEKLKVEDATLLLEFFSWDYDTEGNPYDELMKKYAIIAIQVATANSYNEKGVKDWFANREGYLAIDGSQGVELLSITEYVFDESNLDMEIVES